MPKVNVTKAKIARAANALKEADMQVQRVEVTREGNVIFYMFGSEEPADELNEWDTHL